MAPLRQTREWPQEALTGPWRHAEVVVRGREGSRLGAPYGGADTQERTDMGNALAVMTSAGCINCTEGTPEPGQVACEDCRHLCRECFARPGDQWAGLCDRCLAEYENGRMEWEAMVAREEARARREESY